MSSSAPVRDRRPATAHARPSARRHGAGFWLIALAFVTAMAFSTVPTPLYPLYQERDGFSTLTITIVFAVYAVGVLASLLLAGHVSDWIGRRRALVAGLALELGSAALFLAGPSLAVLLAARLVSGLGIGLITATATAYLHELHAAHRPDAPPRRFEIVSTAANIGGLGLGSLITGFLAQYLGAPLRLPYLVFGGLLIVGVAAVALSPETVRTRPLRGTYRPQRVGFGQGDPASHVAAAATAFSSFAVFGLFTSLSPGFVGATLHHPSRALAGAVVFVVFGGAAAGQTLTDRLGARVRENAGLIAQAAGVVLLAAGMRAASLALFLIGGLLAGVGAGVLFKAAVGAFTAMAEPGRRGEALAGLFLIAYLGLALTAVALGFAVRHADAATVMTWFTALLLALLAAVAVLNRQGRAARRWADVPSSGGRRGGTRGRR